MDAPPPRPPLMRTKADVAAAIRRDRRAALIVNTRSRRGRRHFIQVRRELLRAGFDVLGSFPVHDPERMADVFATALRAKPDLLVVGGGDGTLKEAVRHLVHRDVVLGVLPLGTTNNFARSLRLPLGVRGAVGVFRDGKVADVDVGWIAGRALRGDTFANMVSVGISVRVAEHVPHALKRVVGRAAYGMTAARLMPAHRPFQATITVGEESRRVSTHQLNVANGSHHSGRPITRDASTDDRRLVVYRLGDAARTRLTGATLRHLLTGHRRTLSEDGFLTTRDLVLETDPPLAVDVDGEIRGRTPVRISLLPNALRVMVRQDFPDT